MDSLYLEPPEPLELIPNLNNGLELYKKYAVGVKNPIRHAA
jgi:hypothetical protein